MYDAVHIFALALHELNMIQNINIGPIDCSGMILAQRIQQFLVDPDTIVFYFPHSGKVLYILDFPSHYILFCEAKIICMVSNYCFFRSDAKNAKCKTFFLSGSCRDKKCICT